MIKYKNKINNKIAIVSDNIAAGMCNKTIGNTYVVFKIEDDILDYHFIMESREFKKEYEPLTKLP